MSAGYRGELVTDPGQLSAVELGALVERHAQLHPDPAARSTARLPRLPIATAGSDGVEGDG
jgi:hypothetical protein